MKGFYQQVYDLVEKVPAGTVVTYGDIAKMLGHPRGARLVGYAMGAACETDNRPWHRVTFSDGKLWDGKWEAVQRKMLKAEDVEKYRWRPESVTTPMDLRDLPLKF